MCCLKVVRAKQALPYSRADVEVWPDQEELNAQMGAAMHAVDRSQGNAEVDMSAAMSTVNSAATAAAIACSQVERPEASACFNTLSLLHILCSTMAVPL